MRMYIIINKLMKVITAIKLKYDLKNDLKMNNANSQKKNDLKVILIYLNTKSKCNLVPIYNYLYNKIGTHIINLKMFTLQ